MSNKNYTLTINEESKLITLVYWEGNTPLPVPKDPEDPLQGFEGKVMKTAVNIEGSVNQTLEALLVKLLKHFSEQSSN